MKYLPTSTAEKVYKLLQSKLGANSDHYESEAFIFHYGVINDAPKDHKLKCRDGVDRTFYCNEKKQMWVTGPGTEQVNSILRHMHKELVEAQQLGEFNIVTA
jgi:hypothetical protein